MEDNRSEWCLLWIEGFQVKMLKFQKNYVRSLLYIIDKLLNNAIFTFCHQVCFLPFTNAWVQGDRIYITWIPLNKNRNYHVWFIFSWHVEVNATLNIVHLLFIYYYYFLQTIGAAFCRKDLYIQGRNLSLAIWVGFFISVVVWFCTPSQANLNTIILCFVTLLF